MGLSWRKVVSHIIPKYTRKRFAMELRDEATLARSEGRYRDSALLLEASLRMVADPRIAIQAGHMFKEAGDWQRCEKHYLLALRKLPNDADLSLQLGHFYKIRGSIGEAKRWYARAAEHGQSLSDAARELNALQVPTYIYDASSTNAQAPAPNLLPGSNEAELPELEAVTIRQLGRHYSFGSVVPVSVLRNVEAIRGVCLSIAHSLRADLLVDGGVVASQDTIAIWQMEHGLYKHVFNLWYDFEPLKPGSCQIIVRLVDADGKERKVEREAVVTRLPSDFSVDDYDSVVRGVPRNYDLATTITSRPSVTRPARQSLFTKPPLSILVIRADQLGDMVVSVGAIYRLRRIVPQARIIGLVAKANVELARSLGLFDDVEIVNWSVVDGISTRRLDSAEQHRLRRVLAVYKFDVAIDLVVSAETRSLLLLSGAAFLMGFATPRAPWLTVSVDARTRDPLTGEESASHASRMLALIERFGSLVDCGNPVVPITKSVDDELKDFALMAGGYALLHSGGRLSHLRWPHFATLARRLLSGTDLDVVFFGDPAALVSEGANKRLRIFREEIDFDDFDTLIAGAAVFVGNDSGPKHLAALRGTPTISLHSSRIDWREWGQTQTGTIVSRRVPCAGCGIHGKQEDECGRAYTCIVDITVDEVMNAVSATLGLNTQRHDDGRLR